MDHELYYIQNIGVVGNCMLWWRVDGHGYTVNLDEAWKVGREAAIAICRSRPKEDIPWLAAEVDKAAQRHVDYQRLPKEARLAAR